MDSVEVAKAVASLPLTVLLTLVLIGGYVEWWIYGSIHRSQIKDLEEQLADAKMDAKEWRDRYLTLTQVDPAHIPKP